LVCGCVGTMLTRLRPLESSARPCARPCTCARHANSRALLCSVLFNELLGTAYASVFAL
jgi:hypothetical protein